MIDVLFVCTGNVCRSPFAAMLMNSRMNSSRVTARSAGIQALYGAPLTVPMQRRLQSAESRTCPRTPPDRWAMPTSQKPTSSSR
jgi:protein-tyrosine-phosphatase